MNIETRSNVQNEALKALNTHKKGTVCLSTGTGKSKVAIDYILHDESIRTILITSPRTNLKENWKKELSKWGWEEWTSGVWTKDFDGEKPSRQISIVMENIQTAYKWKKIHFDLIIADEIHTMMTPEYSLLFKNVKYDNLVGLTATHDITNKNDKGEYYKKYAPIIFEYYDSAEHGIINKTRFFIVNHSLGDDLITVRANKVVSQETEFQHYNYLTERIKSGQKRMMAQGSTDWFRDASDWFWKGQGTKEQKFAAMMYLNAIKARKDFLLRLPSSAALAKKIKEGILRDNPDSKVLIFSELTAQANSITKNTIHSHNTKDINEKRMENFNKGIIRDLGSCQSLTLGLNFVGATHAIMESYISSATKSKQKRGRLDRLSTEEVAIMWIIRVSGTQADNWFDKMTKDFDLSEAEYFDSEIIKNDEFNYRENKIKSEVSSA